MSAARSNTLCGSVSFARSGVPTVPSSQLEIGEVVVMQMREQHALHVARAHVGPHHLPRRSVPAVEEMVLAVVEGEQDGRLAAVGSGSAAPVPSITILVGLRPAAVRGRLRLATTAGTPHFNNTPGSHSDSAGT